MRRRLLALLCAAALTAGLLTLPVSASGSLFFLALNDTLPSTSSQTTPIQSNGWIYVPADIFSSKVSGVNLGVYYGLTDNESKLVLYNLSGKTMTFDLQSGTATAVGSKPPTPGKTVKQNGLWYVPAYAVCQYFELTYSYLSTDYGPLLRIRNGSAALSDAMFINSASSLMRSRLSDYNAANAPAATPAAPSSPAAPAVPSGGSAGTASKPASKPSASVKPASPAKPAATPSAKTGGSSDASASEPETVSAPPAEETPVFSLTVGIRATSGGALAGLLDVLSGSAVRGVIFFPADQVTACADGLRQAAGQGHRIGLVPVGNTSEARLESLQEGEKAVQRLIRQEVWFVLNAEEAITEAGYLNWSPGLTLSSSGSVSSLYHSIVDKGADQPNAIRVLASDTLPAGTLSAVLLRLAGDGDTFLTPRETAF